MRSISIPSCRIVSVVLLVVMAFGGGLATGLSQDIETLRKNRVPPTRDQAVGVLSKIQSVMEAGFRGWRHERHDGKRLLSEIQSAIEAGEQHSKDFEDEVNLMKHFHRAPEWNGKRFKGQVSSLHEKGALLPPVIKALSQDGAWGRADELFDKDRLRRRVALHDVKADDCYALVLKNGKAELIFHWNGKTFAILHYSVLAARESLDEFVVEIVSEMQSKDGSARALSHFHLGNLGPHAESAIPALSKLLTHDDPWHRISAALTLWKIDRKAAISLPPLLAVLTDKEMRSSDRTMAANCLFSIGPDAKSAAPALTAAMGEDDLKLRTFCAAALWKIVGDSDSTIPVLIESLKSEGLNVSSAAGRTLAEIISTLREDPGRKAVAEQLTRQLLEISTSIEVRIRIAAIKVLAQIGGENPSVSEALKKALKDENVRIRTSAAMAIKDYDRKLQREGRKADDDPEKRARETNSKGSRAPRETNRKGSRAPRR